ncbi:MAG: hypothetical protein AB1750_06435 [Chloroflexota bacterium]
MAFFGSNFAMTALTASSRVTMAFGFATSMARAFPARFAADFLAGAAFADVFFVVTTLVVFFGATFFLAIGLVAPFSVVTTLVFFSATVFLAAATFLATTFFFPFGDDVGVAFFGAVFFLVVFFFVVAILTSLK